MCYYEEMTYACNDTYTTFMQCDFEKKRVQNNPMTPTDRAGCIDSETIPEGEPAFCCDAQCCEKTIWRDYTQNILGPWETPGNVPEGWYWDEALKRVRTKVDKERRREDHRYHSAYHSFRGRNMRHIDDCAPAFARLDGHNLTKKRLLGQTDPNISLICIPKFWAHPHDLAQQELEQRLLQCFGQQPVAEFAAGNIQDLAMIS